MSLSAMPGNLWTVPVPDYLPSIIPFLGSADPLRSGRLAKRLCSSQLWAAGTRSITLRSLFRIPFP